MEMRDVTHFKLYLEWFEGVSQKIQYLLNEGQVISLPPSFALSISPFPNSQTSFPK